MRRILIVALTVAASGVVFQVPAGAEQHVVTAVLFRYSPSPVQVSSGDTLVFFNGDAASGEGHTVTHAAPDGERLFDSPVVPPGAAGEVIGVADLPTGSYRITCRVFAYMTGILEVRRAR